MDNVVIVIRSTPGTVPDRVEAVCAQMFASLVSCLPGLLHSEQECERLAGGEVVVCSCTLWFPNEDEKRFALSSMEWVELIDETADVLDWESVEYHAGQRPLGTDLVLS